jgi:hypothetical protein
VLGDERAQELSVGVGGERETELRGRGGRHQHQHDYRRRIHRRVIPPDAARNTAQALTTAAPPRPTSALLSLTTRPSTSCTVRFAYYAARSGLWG